jgi:cob(I)alamin adenosyltransferase
VTSIYTRTGDQGETGLFGGGRIGKDDPRVEAYGEVDELNASLGMARSSGLDPQLEALVAEIQAQLFTLGAVLATPSGTKAETYIPQVRPEWSLALERAIDEFDRELTPLQQFILPGGTPAASHLHLARTVCRRAERRVVSLSRAISIEPQLLVYLNRLSDLLFVMARVANHRAGVPDVPWSPPA